LTPATNSEFSWSDAELFDSVRQLKTVQCHLKKCDSQSYSVGKATDYKIENRISISGWGGNFLSIPLHSEPEYVSTALRTLCHEELKILSWKTPES
jgi:hypothetical protein